MIKEQFLCPECGQTYTGSILLHIADNCNTQHIAMLKPLVVEIIKLAPTKYAFEIAEVLVTDKHVSLTLEEATSFVSRIIPLLGFNRRKCVSKERQLEANAIFTNVLSDQTAINYICTMSVPRHIKRQYASMDAPKYLTKQYANRNRVPLTFNPDQNVVEITKIFSFAAAHHLPGHPRLCQYTHGHEWKLEVTVKDTVDPVHNMVLDFSTLKAIVKKHIIDVLDHNYINDILWNPTAENLCAWICDELYANGLTNIHKVKLWEAEDSFAVLEADPFLY